MSHRSMSAVLAVLALALGLGSSQEWELAAPDPRILFAPPALARIEEHACAECHAEVAAEWAASAHGLAWEDEHYQAALAETKKPALCHGCHVPEPLFATGALAERADARAADGPLELRWGIACESCHVDADGAVLGPRGTPTDAHASRASEHMGGAGANALCATCHSTTIGPVFGVAKDFAGSARAAEGATCVGCHMAPVERAWASGAPARVGRSHALQTPRDPAFLRRAFDARRELVDGRERVVITNRAGHRVPGLVGRTIELEAQLLDARGTLVETATLAIDERAYLPVDGIRTLAFTKPGASVRLVGRHLDPRAREALVFLDEQLEREN